MNGKNICIKTLIIIENTSFDKLYNKLKNKKEGFYVTK